MSTALFVGEKGQGGAFAPSCPDFKAQIAELERKARERDLRRLERLEKAYYSEDLELCAMAASLSAYLVLKITMPERAYIKFQIPLTTIALLFASNRTFNCWLIRWAKNMQRRRSWRLYSPGISRRK